MVPLQRKATACNRKPELNPDELFMESATPTIMNPQLRQFCAQCSTSQSLTVARSQTPTARRFSKGPKLRRHERQASRPRRCGCCSRTMSPGPKRLRGTSYIQRFTAFVLSQLDKFLVELAKAEVPYTEFNRRFCVLCACSCRRVTRMGGCT